MLVRVGESFDLSTFQPFNLSTPPLRWACYDADRVAVSPHPDNKWQKRIRYFNDVADISPDGVLTAKKEGECVVLAIATNGDKEFFAVCCNRNP